MDNNNGKFSERLASRWRRDAHSFAEYGAHWIAEVLIKCASELEAGIREYEAEALTLDMAALESGFSYSALQKKVASGDLPNVGQPGKPRVRRRDLPRKGASAEAGILAETILVHRLAR